MVSNVHETIMLFGDSITQGGWETGGFGHRLAHVYARKLDVVNRGYSGYNTEWAIPVLRQCLATAEAQKHSPKIRLLTIWFGANDACIKPSPQHLPIEKFKQNLHDIIQMVTAASSPYYSPDTKIVLITPPPINTHQRRADLESRDPPLALDRLFEVTKSYADAVKEVASQEKVAVTDVWTAFWEASGKDEQNLEKVMDDGLHPNARGYDIVFDALIKTIAEEYPELHYDKLKPVFPPWAEIDWSNPGPSLIASKVD